jgi:hypothetical protein
VVCGGFAVKTFFIILYCPNGNGYHFVLDFEKNGTFSVGVGGGGGVGGWGWVGGEIKNKAKLSHRFS